jgi:hypothetical protein
MMSRQAPTAVSAGRARLPAFVGTGYEAELTLTNRSRSASYVRSVAWERS